MNSISGLMLALIVILMFHLVEEIKTGFRHKLPFGTMPLPVFIGTNIAIYIFCAVTVLLSVIGSDLAATFGWVLAVGMLVNGMGHIGMMAAKRHYFPGGLTAFLIVPLATVLILHLLR